MELDINILNKNIKQKDKEISELKKENLNLKSILETYKNKFYFVKHFIMDKIMRSKEKEKYIELTQNLYDIKLLIMMIMKN